MQLIVSEDHDLLTRIHSFGNDCFRKFNSLTQIAATMRWFQAGQCLFGRAKISEGRPDHGLADRTSGDDGDSRLSGKLASEDGSFFDRVLKVTAGVLLNEHRGRAIDHDRNILFSTPCFRWQYPFADQAGGNCQQHNRQTDARCSAKRCHLSNQTKDQQNKSTGCQTRHRNPA